MLFGHIHEFHDDSTIDTQPTISSETSQDGVTRVASVSQVDSSSDSESTGTDFDADSSNVSPSSRVFGYGSDESDPVALDDMDGSEVDEDDLESLEVLEFQLAVEYGMVKPDADPHSIDSVAVFEETRHRVLMSEDESAYRVSYDKLHRLYELRTWYASGDEPRVMKHKAFPTSTGTPHRIDASRFWAVIIGIDAYRRNTLHGCVADALLMKEYLEKDLKVPSDRIQLLLGTRSTSYDDPSYPSRENITKTLCSLISNPNIKKGDNIIIYFAGHGSSYLCSQCPRVVKRTKSIVSDVHGTRTQGQGHVDVFCPIEAICPIDRSRDDVDEPPIITDISDRELNTYLHEISRAKGNKITAIFDCCHSYGVTRGDRPRMRRVPPQNGKRDLMLRVGMHNLKRISNRTSIMDKRWRPDMSSHVILAACKEFELAKEVKVVGRSYHGFFTHSLVKALRSGSWTKELTYDDLVRKLPREPKQTPAVAGDLKSERLWYQTT
ncbi:hypothetical protein IW261DRAFT_1634792 [Armillaria novae-zelandiae]|uniref:Peptidase C14 caspase domain-containing protein n=1 Tax=Armillaria novae-zelandiae TaxID=153914 RepID=A0AA39P4J0_9AGAR|nr:hypothetical protein IW261DRAFT_1634792 [Armillaria novae-zelandiae]